MNQILAPEGNGSLDAAALLADIPVGLFWLDREGHFTRLNPAANRFFQQACGRSAEGLAGKSIWQECPEVADSAFAKACRQAEAENRDVYLESYFPALRRWFSFRGGSSAEGLCFALQDTTERAELEQSLVQRAEQLAESARGKEHFLAELAHELRDALGPIRNALHVWGTQDLGREGEQTRALAEQEVRHISGLMENLLKVVQLTWATSQTDLASLDLVGVAVDALRTALISPAARGHQLLVDLPSEPLPVHGDRALLEQALGHLLANAAKFTRPGGQIGLRLGREEGQAVLRVRDNGVGIAAQVLPRIFNLFMSADWTRGRLGDGLGVGLTLVRRVAELHGGTVEAHSEGPDRGSEFVLRLPAPEQALPQPPASEGPRQEPLQVLVVDNSKEAAQSIALLLQTWGYQVRVTYDPFAALESARTQPPAVVLLDIGMPGMDGYEVARRLRQQPESQNVMLVAVTGYGEAEDRDRARAAGFDYHMTKPVDPNDLRSLLELAASAERSEAAS